MIKIWSDRRLFIATLAMALMVWKPELAQTLMLIAMTIAGSNAAEKILTAAKK